MIRQSEVKSHKVDPPKLDHAKLTDAVRTTVRERMAARLSDIELAYSETVLLKDGNYCGRCFRWGDCAAIWTIEIGEIRFFDAERKLVESVPVPEASPERELSRTIQAAA